MTRKKIAIFLYSMGSGGAERQVSYLLRTLKNRYRITLVLMNDTRFFDIPEEVETIFLERSDPYEEGWKKLLKLPLLAWRLKRLLRKRNITLCLSLMTRPNYINILAKRFGSGATAIISERSMFSLQYAYGDLQSRINLKLSALYNHADLIVANAKNNAYDLTCRLGIRTPVTTVYNAVDLDEIQRRMHEKSRELDTSRFTFITVGRLDAGKNHRLLIRAIAQLDASLYIIGEGPLRETLQQLINELNLDTRVHLLGRHTNPYALMAQADAFVFASNHEGMPNVILEALACGLPVISTDCQSGPREILAPATDFLDTRQEGYEIAEYGILTAINDETAMQEAMRILMKDETLRQQLYEKGQRRIADFSVKNAATRFAAIIDERLS